MSDKYGVIHEIGDLGLGFDEVSDKDQKTLKEQQQEDDRRKEQK
jgi:hypothetical protein